MKKTRTLIYVIISIVALSVLLFVLVNGNQKTNDADGKAENLIENFEQVTDINVFASENISLMKAEQGWQLVDAENEIDTDKMESFLLAMEEMTGKAVDVDKKNVNLDFPKVTVSFTDQQGDSQKISVGQMRGQGDQYYVEHKEKQSIYLVDRSAVEMIPLQRVALLNNKILTVTSEDVTDITIDNGTEVIQLSKESPFSEKEALAHLSGWYMHKPYQNVYSVAFSNTEEMVVGVDGIEHVEIVNGEDDYGLADSDFSIVFSNGEKEEKLIVGEPAANNQYYVQVEGEEVVYKIPTELLDPYSHQAYDMIDHFVHIVSLEVIDELSIETPEDKVHYTMEHEKNAEEEIETTVFRDEIELEIDAFRDDYKQLAGLTFDQAYNGESVEDEPEVMITYLITDENDEVMENSIEFRAISDTHYAIIKNNSSEIDFTVQKDKLHQAIERVIQAES
ncbi:DUF4340 domain-containing protein [Gracilibacillus salitolerans]|uniref:DUF4340 domain-containing protein n=1 Tax=Gracilibacillus salitolerans TaxID=2663022 RepID=A0A5Q2TH30_9BACI|nr:DUF4340 domain-containing protein [Gracilibacillus salitolerans]QGH33965.1 DUF4340 domain-containing protein [Gracilibacillus salitolerans]